MPLSAHAKPAADELAFFFTQSLDLLCIAGLDGRFERLNPAWTADLGWTLEELEARSFLELVHPDDREATKAEVAKLAAGVDPIAFENRYRRRDGSYRWLQWSARPMRGRRQIAAIARDVTRQKRLEREILEIADREKERLGQELHDGLCQTLAGIAALSSTLARRLEGPDAAAAAEIGRLLNGAIAEARGLARGLDPVALAGHGLDEALAALAGNVQRLFRVSCAFACEGPFPGLCPEVAAHLFRIGQEAVSNAVTHAEADRIEIGLGRQNGHGLLRVRDDGVGLPEAAPGRDGSGLHTMAYRSRLIGASFEVRRRARCGTVVLCSFPLPETGDPGEDLDHVRDVT